ncbi:MOB kinase activator 3B isoform X1 [Bubalus kerabau]|uniref:MOB kinase activator 3B isoform X1 n=1 Tax=Bubalus carabanensis TaxID=3119969 RepID=UPI00244EAC92|nr:MOB kinase activator 3B isoform X1 [Bubalus carabanensis]
MTLRRPDVPSQGSCHSEGGRQGVPAPLAPSPKRASLRVPVGAALERRRRQLEPGARSPARLLRPRALTREPLTGSASVAPPAPSSPSSSRAACSCPGAASRQGPGAEGKTPRKNVKTLQLSSDCSCLPLDPSGRVQGRPPAPGNFKSQSQGQWKEKNNKINKRRRRKNPLSSPGNESPDRTRECVQSPALCVESVDRFWVCRQAPEGFCKRRASPPLPLTARGLQSEDPKGSWREGQTPCRAVSMALTGARGQSSASFPKCSMQCYVKNKWIKLEVKTS